MARTLILNPDEQFATQLFSALAQLGSHSVSSTPVFREACLIVSQQPQDVVFIPYENYESVLESLRFLQPSLRVVVTVDEAQAELPAADIVQGVLVRSQLHSQLPAVLLEALARPVPPPPNGQPLRALNENSLTALLQRTIDDERLLSIVLAEKGQVMAHAGTLDDQQAGRVAQRVQNGWENEEGGTAQIQFISLPGRVSELMLYSRPVGNSRLLSLTALPEMTVTPLRQRADALARQLASIGAAPAEQAEPEVPPVAPLLTTPAEPEVNTIAIIWRPVAPLPPVLSIPLRRALERIAERRACVLNALDIRPDYVHLLVTCPPGRDSAWVAHRFKTGSETEIQKQFGVQAALWQRGYFAAASPEPFSERQIQLYLESPPPEALP